MDADTPTHFNAIIVGTGLTESIVAAALSKAGYSVLQLDQSNVYGDQWASLSLQELSEWASTTPGASSSPSSPPQYLLPTGQRFSISLLPTLLRASGPAIDVLVRSKVSSYLSFGKLNGVGLWTRESRVEGEDAKGKGKIERVPSSKSDVFNHPTLSLVEKRRLTKLLLLAAGQEPLKEDLRLIDPDMTLRDCLERSFLLSPTVSSSLAYALTLCSSEQDQALPALERLRSFIHSSGRYGPSPFLVGHYGGAGDLVGGFSRICAVWGGGQVLGRPIKPLIVNAKPKKHVAPLQPLFSAHSFVPPPPALPSADLTTTTRPLGIPVQIEADKPTDVFTGDWVISAGSHVPLLFPDVEHSNEGPKSVNAIVILPTAVPYPSPREVPEDEASEPDSNVFVFAPREFSDELGTVTAMQVGSGTFATPAGSFLLYLSAPLLTATLSSASDLLSPYLEALLALAESPIEPSYSVFYPSAAFPSSPSSGPANLLVVPPLPSLGRTSLLATALDEAVEEAERMFWRVVGEEGKKEGVKFFERDLNAVDEEDE